MEENIFAVGTAADNGAAKAVKKNDVTVCVTETEIRAKYTNLFDGVGLLVGDVHLDTDKTVMPVEMPLRRPPIGVRD